MSRIRTIKPDFFTSLTIANLPLSARLTFIGMWTHVDDDGRCVDDPRLIKAAVWPLDDCTAADVDEDLKALTESSLILRYEVDGRRYLTVCGWAEHQHINRKTNSKLPAPKPALVPPPPPPVDAVTSGNEPSGTDGETLMDGSVSNHGGLTSGMEGKGSKTAPAKAALPKASRKDGPEGERADAVATRFYDSVQGVCNFMAVKAVVLKVVKAGFTDAEIDTALSEINRAGRPITADVMRAVLKAQKSGPSRRPGIAPNRFAEQ